MKAYVLVNPNNNRLIDNNIPTYPAIFPKYDIIFGPTTDTVKEVPSWYLERDIYYNESARIRGYCTYLGHISALLNHYNSYPDEDLLVMEDDVEFNRAFTELYTSFMTMVPANWDALHFGGWYYGTEMPFEVVPNVLKPQSKSYLVGAECILLRSNLIKRIVEHTKSTNLTNKYQFDYTLAMWSSDDIIKMYSPVVMFAHQRVAFSSITDKITDHNCNNNKFVKYIDINGVPTNSTEEDLSRYTYKN